MTKYNEKESLEEFVISILKEEEANHEYYGCISRFNEDSPFWSLFLMCDGTDGKKYCSGHYPLNIADMGSLENIFSMFSEQGRKIVVNTNGYFSED